MKNLVFKLVLSTTFFTLAACDGGSSSKVSEPVSPELQADQGQVSQSEGSVENPSAPQPESVGSQGQSAGAEATVSYWEGWSTFRDRLRVAAEAISTEYSVENSIALSSLYKQIADDLGGLSAVAVDPELAELAATAVALYRERERLFQEEANILSKWRTFTAKRDSDETAVGSVLVFLFNEEDRFAVPRSLAQEAEQLKGEWNRSLQLLTENDQKIQAMATQRDTLKIRLESRYGVALGQILYQ